MRAIARLLKQIGELVGGSAGALGVIGVASRADEIGAGRIDAMLSAKDVAKRFTNEMDKTGICQAVVPVSGVAGADRPHVASERVRRAGEAGRVEAVELTKAMLSVDRFVREDSSLPVDAATRAALLDRFGMFGVRISIAVLRAGVSDSVALADELLERSGLVALRGRHRPAVRATLRSAQGAHRAAVAAAVRRDQSDLCDPLHRRGHRPASGRYACLRRTSAAESITVTPNDIERGTRWRRCDASSAALAPTRQADWGLQPDAPYDGRARRSRRLSDGGGARTIPSTTHSPPARAGRPCAAPRRW